MTSRVFPMVLTCGLLLTACGADAEQAALEAYLAEAKEIGMQLSDVGTKLETLMNVQADALAWTQAERDELAAIVASFADLTERTKATTPPALLIDVHPLLISAIEEMHAGVADIQTLAEHPSEITPKMAEEMEAHATKGEQYADEYARALAEAVNAEYPDMLEE